jgi:hypothetical protein
MAMTIAEATIIPAGTVIPFGSYTEAAPAPAGVGAVVGPFADYADTFVYRITNGSTAPGSPIVIVFYALTAGGRWYEVDRVSGDVVAGSTGVVPPSGTIPCPAGCVSFTAKAFGNTSQNVTVEVYLARQVP